MMTQFDLRKTRLYDKVLGCYAGSSIGASMGAALEWVALPDGGYKALEERFGGLVEKLLPWTQVERDVRYWNGPKLHYYHMDHPAGMTEDGTELKYLLAKAIIEKGGPIAVEDLADVWRRDIDPDTIGYLINPHIRIFVDRLSGGDSVTRIPPSELGSMTHWPGMVDAMMMVSPIGILRAGDPWQAAQDTKNVASLLQSRVGYGLDCAAAEAAAVAEAMRPNATVDSVIEAAKAYVASPVAEVIDEAIDIAEQYPDIRSVREPFAKKYGWLPAFDGLEVLAESMAIFYISKGDVRTAIIGGANFGRDTDCIACIAGAIAGAFSGASKLPQEWIDTVDSATAQCTVSVQKRSTREVSEDLTRIVQRVIEDRRRQVNEVGFLESEKVG